MPALERRGSLSRTVHVPVSSSPHLFPTSSSTSSTGGSAGSAGRGSAGSGGGRRASARAALSSLLGYTAAVTVDAVQYVGKSLAVSAGKGAAGPGTADDSTGNQKGLLVFVLLRVTLVIVSHWNKQASVCFIIFTLNINDLRCFVLVIVSEMIF